MDIIKQWVCDINFMSEEGPSSHQEKSEEEEILERLGLKKGWRVRFTKKFWDGRHEGEIGIIMGIDDYGDLVFYDEEQEYMSYLGKGSLTEKDIKESFTIIEEPSSVEQAEKTEIQDPSPASINEQEEDEEYLDYFDPKTQGYFNKLSSKAKEMAIQAYKNYRIHGLIDKIGDARFWINKYEDKSVEFKNKMENLDLEVRAFEQSKKEIESKIESLQSQNAPGVAPLELKIKIINQQIINLLNEKDKIQSKFEAMENKAKLYLNKRDDIADKIIGHYNEKLEPIETELENLQTCRSQVDLAVAETEVEHQEQMTKLNNIKKRIMQIEIGEELQRKEISEGEIRKLEKVKKSVEFLAKSFEKEKETLAQRKRKINERIAKLDAKANKYRDKQVKFARIKGNRLLRGVSQRQMNSEFTNREEIRTHPRREAGEDIYATDESKRWREETPEGDYFRGNEALSHLEEPIQEQKKAKESNEETRLTVNQHIINWNNAENKEYGHSEKISLDDFLEKTGLSKKVTLSLQNFGKILKDYYKLKKKPMDEFNNKMISLKNKK